MSAMLLGKVQSGVDGDHRLDCPSLCFSGDPGDVVVHASDFQDVLLIRDSLKHCNLEEEMNASSQAVPSNKQFYASIICHRRGQDDLVRAILHKVRAQRVVVVSDSYDEDNIVSLLNMGAHQLISIEQTNRVLSARLGAALRNQATLAKQKLTADDIEFDIQSRSVRRAGNPVDLSPKEFELAYFLFSNSGRVVGNPELMTSVWSLPSHMDTRRIDTAACRVRKKLALISERGWELKRIRGVGYRLVYFKEQCMKRRARSRAISALFKRRPPDVLVGDAVLS